MTITEQSIWLHPEISAHVESVWRDIATGTPFVCHHPTPALIVCAAHPRLGLMCPECAQSHTERHTHADEFTCDACCAVDDEIYGIAIVRTASGIRCRRTKGKHGLLYGTVVIGALGLCRGCREEVA